MYENMIDYLFMLWGYCLEFLNISSPAYDYLCMLWSSQSYLEVEEYLNAITSNLSLVISTLGYVTIGYIIAGITTYVFCNKSTHQRENKRILFITGHPGDESLYFGPTIIKLRDTCELHLLWLHSGGTTNDISLNKRELYASCTRLGIPIQNIRILRIDRMPSTSNELWNANRTAGVLLHNIETLTIDEVYTFDIAGVTGHINHAALFYGFANLCLTCDIKKYCKVFILESVNVTRKYTSFFDITPSVMFSKHYFIVNLEEHSVIWDAMTKIKNQMTWYHQLYAVFGRYMIINTYKELDADDVDLVLQMHDYNPFLN